MHINKSTKAGHSIISLALAAIFVLHLFGTALAPVAWAAEPLGVDDIVHSRAYSTGGSGNALPDEEHTISFVISQANVTANSLTWPLIIDDDFVTDHGSTYLLTGEASAQARIGSSTAGGLVRIETTQEIVLIVDDVNFSTSGATEGQNVFGPLTIGTANPSGTTVTAKIRSNVTLVILDGTENKFTSHGGGTNLNCMDAGISVAFGSSLTIRSGFTAETQAAGKTAGILTARGGYFAAGIGEGPNRRAGTVVITGGIVKAYSSANSSQAGANNGAGIGGGGGNSWGGGSQEGIEIYGDAHVTAHSYGNGAGLGGAGGGGQPSGQATAGAGNSGPINIYGDAIVVASSASRGAGIGGGGRSDTSGSGTAAAGNGTLINIHGNAHVTATSGVDENGDSTGATSGSGAGIGGAGAMTSKVPAGHCVEVNIYGNATVIAKSMNDGAGIGGGGSSGGGTDANGGDGGNITIRDEAKVTASSGGRGAGIGGGGASGGTGTNVGNAGSSGDISISGMPVVSGTSGGCGAGIGGGGSETGGIAGAFNFIHIFGGDEKNDPAYATLGPTVTTHSVRGTDLGAGRQGDDGPKGTGENIVITSGSVRAWDSDIVTSGTEFSNKTRLVMAQAKNYDLGQIVLWPINPDTFPLTTDVPTYLAGIGDYNYVATVSEHLLADGTKEQPTAYLWVPYAYQVLYESGGAPESADNKMPIDFEYLIHNDKATVLGIGKFTYPGHKFTGWMDKATGIIYQAGDSFYVKSSMKLEAQWEDAYTVTYQNGGATGTVPVDGGSYTAGEKATVLGKGDLIKGADKFVGWLSDVDSKIYQEGNLLNITENVVLTAQWATASYTVTYDDVGSDSGSAPDGSSHAPNSDVTVVGNVNIDPLVKDGFVLYGWTPDGWTQGGGGTLYKIGDTFKITENVTLTPVWGHEVQYASGGADRGSAPVDASAPYLPGVEVTVLGNTSSNPYVKTGYTFGGWSDGTTTHQAGEKFTITKNTTLTAVWVAETYKITYFAGVGTGTPPVDTNSYSYGQGVLLAGNEGSPKLVLTDYEFVGWTPNPSAASPKLYAPGSILLIDDESCNLTAVFRKMHTVTFDTGAGGSTINPVKVSDNGYIPMPTNPTRAGYDFVKWYIDESLASEWTFGHKVTEDTTLYAKWNPVYYSVTYDKGEGTGSMPSGSTGHPYKQPVTVLFTPLPTHPSGGTFTFQGWSDGAGGFYSEAGIKEFLIAQDTTLTAVYAAPLEVTFDPKGGAPAPSTQMIPAGQYASAPSAMTKVGYTFDGWWWQKGADEYKWDFGSKVTGALELVAHWKAITYKVVYVPNGAGVGNMPSDLGSYGINSSITISTQTPTRTGYTFLGWKSNQDNASSDVEGPSITVDGSRNPIHLTAQWKLNQYTVSFVANGGTTAPDNQIVVYGALVSEPPAMTKAGHTFVGWYRDASFATKWIFGTDTVTADVTLYAKWSTDPRTVTFVLNGGTMTASTTENIDYGTEATEPNPAPTKDGYDFDGWYENATFTETAWDFDTLITANMTLHAKWTKLHTITYQYNDEGSTANTTDDVRDGEKATAPTPTRSGYTFDGWYESNVFAGTAWDFDTPVTADMTLYAQWAVAVVKHDVTFEPNAPLLLATVEKIPHDTKIPTPTSPIYDHNLFEGWYTDDDTFLDKWDFDTDVVTTDITLYAKWTLRFSLEVVSGANGAITPPIAATYRPKDDTISIVATPDSGFVFDRWTTDPAGSGTFGSATSASTTFTMPAMDVIVIANFKAIGGSGGGGGNPTGNYTVVYDANGGSGSYHVSGFASGAKHTAYSERVTGIRETDFILVGWNTKPDGSGTFYAPGDIVTVSGNLILYAQWEADPLVLEGNREVPYAPWDNGMGLLVGDENHIPFFQGYVDNSFRPDNPITRAEVSAIFFRLLAGSEKDGYVPSKFQDMPSGQWYTQYVNYLAHIGILTGYPDGDFRPHQSITRAEFVTIVARFHDSRASDWNSFTDVNVGHWASADIFAAYRRGWISGYPDGTFRPDDSITRAEAAKIVNAQLGRMVDTIALDRVINPYNDVSRSHWAYADIIEASLRHEHTRESGGGELWLAW